jgi:hypothetical protein
MDVSYKRKRESVDILLQTQSITYIHVIQPEGIRSISDIREVHVLLIT